MATRGEEWAMGDGQGGPRMTHWHLTLRLAVLERDLWGYLWVARAFNRNYLR